MAFLPYTFGVPDSTLYLDTVENNTAELVADHEHLVEYLSASFKYAPHPLPLGEKRDTVYNGVKVSMRVYMDSPCPYFTAITSGGTVRISYGGFEKGHFEKILSAYNPSAQGKDNIYHYGRY